MNTRNIKFTIGGPESPIGTAATRTAVLPLREKPSFREQAEKAVDPAIVGRNMTIGEYLVARNLGGGLPLSPRPCEGFGKVLNSLLGQEGTPAQVDAVIRIRYSGSEDSAKVSASAAGDTLTCEVGDLGSEAGDTNFGTSGTIDLTDTATDTVTELVSVIDGYTDYEAELVTGDGATDAAEILSITAEQGKGRWVYVYFGSADSGVYRHTFEVDLTNTARPGYSLQGDGVHDNFLGLGVVFDQLSISGALKAMVEAEATGYGFSWTGGQSASSEELEAVDPFLFYDGSFSINGVKHPFIRNFSLDAMNNHNTEGYGQGSTARQYHDKGMFDATASVQLRYSADAYALYAKVFNNQQAGMDLYFRTPSALSGSIYGLMVIEAPFVNVSDYDSTDNSGVLDATINLKVVNPPNQYGSPLRITLLTADSGAY